MITIIRRKMKKSDYKPGMFFFISLFLISFTLSAQEVTKEFHKEYTAGTKTLDISNKYGDVEIQSWDKDQIIINVNVTVDSFNFSGWGYSKKFRINYNIKMPVGTDLTLTNKYGNTDIDELHGLMDIEIKYGNLTAGKLTRGNIKPLSKLVLAYGKGTIDETGWLDLNERYVGSMEIAKSQALLLDSKYSKIMIGETSSIVGESKYDNIKIENINNLVLENGYTEVNIGELTKKLTYNGSYGSFSIDRIPAGFESLDVETHYMGVKLGIEESASY